MGSILVTDMGPLPLPHFGAPKKLPGNIISGAVLDKDFCPLPPPQKCVLPGKCSMGETELQKMVYGVLSQCQGLKRIRRDPWAARTS